MGQLYTHIVIKTKVYLDIILKIAVAGVRKT